LEIQKNLLAGGEGFGRPPFLDLEPPGGQGKDVGIDLDLFDGHFPVKIFRKLLDENAFQDGGQGEKPNQGINRKKKDETNQNLLEPAHDGPLSSG